MSDWSRDAGLAQRAAIHAALGDPARLAVVEELRTSDRSPTELIEMLGIGSNLLAHHLDVLEHAGVIVRTASAGDGRRRYVRLVTDAVAEPRSAPRARDALFLCSHNSARSQLAAALWRARTGREAASAGTRPAARVHRGAVAAARRAGLSLDGATPLRFDRARAGVQVITVCDQAHETLDARRDWWHWSIPDPVPLGTAAAFDAVVVELDRRIAAVTACGSDHGGG